MHNNKNNNKDYINNHNSSSNRLDSTLIYHLIELRSRLIKALSIVILLFLSLIYWAGDIYNAFVLPLKKLLPNNSQMVFGDVTGVFLIPLKVTFCLALLICLP